jgi:hypothetical protein
MTIVAAVLVGVALVVVAALASALGAPWWLTLGVVGALCLLVVLAYVAG